MKTTPEYEAALKRLRDSKAGKHTNGLEAQYSKAYARMVKAGIAPPLRGKYRKS